MASELFGRTVEGGIVEKGRQVGTPCSRVILYIYAFRLVEASGVTVITYTCFQIEGRPGNTAVSPSMLKGD